MQIMGLKYSNRPFRPFAWLPPASAKTAARNDNFSARSGGPIPVSRQSIHLLSFSTARFLKKPGIPTVCSLKAIKTDGCQLRLVYELANTASMVRSWGEGGIAAKWLLVGTTLFATAARESVKPA
jgi:hypothetical protein